jgi:hypothetical protein
MNRCDEPPRRTAATNRGDGTMRRHGATTRRDNTLRHAAVTGRNHQPQPPSLLLFPVILLLFSAPLPIVTPF